MNTIIVILFVAGYCAIAFEQTVKINKSAVALLTGVSCWATYILMGHESELINKELIEHLGDLSGILFFLMGAMAIVELIDSHDGFEVITSRISTTDKRKLLWITCFLAFFLSAILDNLTTAIVMVSLLRKLIDSREVRLFFIGMVVIAANAGGAWSPIGDVTTTMLWIGGQVSADGIVFKLIIPSLVCLLVPLILLTFKLKGTVQRPTLNKPISIYKTTDAERNFIFVIGIGALLFVPVFKTVTHLPPFMGMLFALGLVWIITELIHKKKKAEDKDTLSVLYALQKIDMPSILFFLGILIAITALQSIGVLSALAQYMDQAIGNISIIIPLIGLLSAIVDNVPLVAASMGMYDLNTFPQDSYLWELLAYCAGTGGSILIIGSAAGIAAMGMEKITFTWYLRRIAGLALIGYVAGVLCYMAIDRFFA